MSTSSNNKSFQTTYILRAYFKIHVSDPVNLVLIKDHKALRTRGNKIVKVHWSWIAEGFLWRWGRAGKEIHKTYPTPYPLTTPLRFCNEPRKEMLTISSQLSLDTNRYLFVTDFEKKYIDGCVFWVNVYINIVTKLTLC